MITINTNDRASAIAIAARLGFRHVGEHEDAGLALLRRTGQDDLNYGLYQRGNEFIVHIVREDSVDAAHRMAYAAMESLGFEPELCREVAEAAYKTVDFRMKNPYIRL